MQNGNGGAERKGFRQVIVDPVAGQARGSRRRRGRGGSPGRPPLRSPPKTFSFTYAARLEERVAEAFEREPWMLERRVVNFLWAAIYEEVLDQATEDFCRRGYLTIVVEDDEDSDSNSITVTLPMTLAVDEQEHAVTFHRCANAVEMSFKNIEERGRHAIQVKSIDGVESLAQSRVRMAFNLLDERRTPPAPWEDAPGFTVDDD